MKNNSINSQNICLIIWGVIVVFFDQISKHWAGTLKSPDQFFFLSFEKFYNPGISFGQFSDGAPFYKSCFSKCFFWSNSFIIKHFYFLF